MASIFNGLNIGYSGLTASQLGINTTGQNISNAEKLELDPNLIRDIWEIIHKYSLNRQKLFNN